MVGNINTAREFVTVKDIADGRVNYSHDLAELFDRCEFLEEKDMQHPIYFEESVKRLKKKCKTVLRQLQAHGRILREFVIGKSFVNEKPGCMFRSFDPTTWRLGGGGFTSRWQDYKSKGYHGIVVIGCVDKDLIPRNLKHKNIDHEFYVLALEQALIHHYTLKEPTASLGNTSLDCGNKSDSMTERAGVIYMAVQFKDEQSDTNVSNMTKSPTKRTKSPLRCEKERSLDTARRATKPYTGRSNETLTSVIDEDHSSGDSFHAPSSPTTANNRDFRFDGNGEDEDNSRKRTFSCLDNQNSVDDIDVDEHVIANPQVCDGQADGDSIKQTYLKKSDKKTVKETIGCPANEHGYEDHLSEQSFPSLLDKKFREGRKIREENAPVTTHIFSTDICQRDTKDSQKDTAETVLSDTEHYLSTNANPDSVKINNSESSDHPKDLPNTVVYKEVDDTKNHTDREDTAGIDSPALIPFTENVNTQSKQTCHDCTMKKPQEANSNLQRKTSKCSIQTSEMWSNVSMENYSKSESTNVEIREHIDEKGGSNGISGASVVSCVNHTHGREKEGSNSISGASVVSCASHIHTRDFCVVCQQHERTSKQKQCSSCSRVFHLECYVPRLTEFPKEENWICLLCEDEVNLVVDRRMDKTDDRRNTRGGSVVALSKTEAHHTACQRILLELFCYETFRDFNRKLEDDKANPQYTKMFNDLVNIRSKLEGKHLSHYVNEESCIIDLKTKLAKYQKIESVASRVSEHLQNVIVEKAKVFFPYISLSELANSPSDGEREGIPDTISANIPNSTGESRCENGEKTYNDHLTMSSINLQLTSYANLSQTTANNSRQPEYTDVNVSAKEAMQSYPLEDSALYSIDILKSRQKRKRTSLSPLRVGHKQPKQYGSGNVCEDNDNRSDDPIWITDESDKSSTDDDY